MFFQQNGDSTASKPTATSEMKAPVTVNNSQASQMSTESKSSTTQSNSSASSKAENQLWSAQKRHNYNNLWLIGGNG